MIAAIFRKEWKDHLRDRRSVFSSLLVSIIGPVVFLITFSRVAASTGEDQPLVLAVAGAANAPNLVAFLQRQGVIVEQAPEDFEAPVRDGKLSLALFIPEDYGREFEAGRSAPVRLVEDSSRLQTRQQAARVRRLLEGYSRRLSALRMIARGVSPSLVAPLDLTDVDLATPEKTAANVLQAVPFFLLMSVFFGGLQLASDLTAGERERGSLEPLLVNAVPRMKIAIGKWLAVLASVAAALLVALAGCAWAVARLPLQDLGIRFRFGPQEVLGFLGACLPLALLVAALQMTAALFARTYKEAQTYLSLMMLLPMVTAGYLTLQPMKATLPAMLVPVLGQTLLMSEVLHGEPLRIGLLLLAALPSAFGAGVLLWWIGQLFERERIVFGRGSGS